MTYAFDHRPAKGTALVARQSVEALLERCSDYDITLIHYESTDDPLYTHQGVREVIFPVFRWRILNRRFLRQLWYFLTTDDFFDVIQWFQPRLYPFFWLAPAKRIIATLHGAGDVTALHAFSFSRFIFNWTIRFGKKYITQSIAVSEYAKHEIHAAYGISLNRITVIPNGVDVVFHRIQDMEKMRTVRTRYHLPETFFLNIARLNRHKNVPRLIDAFAQYLVTTSDSETVLVNVGMSGDDVDRVRAAINRHNLSERVVLVPYVEQEDLASVYSLASVFVFPSLNEGFGLPVIEAMACGTPVITSSVTSLPEIGGMAAVYVDPYDVADIAYALARLHTDADLRESCIRRGYARAAAFRWEDQHKRLQDLYENILTSI